MTYESYVLQYELTDFFNTLIENKYHLTWCFLFESALIDDCAVKVFRATYDDGN